MSTSDLTQRPILITGASGGIGTALVEHLLESGFSKLALNYRTGIDGLESVLRKHDIVPDQVCFQADLTQENQVAELRKRVLERYGRLWGMVHLAGSTSNAMSWKLSLDDFNSVVAGSLTSTFLVCREFIPSMREAGGGRIITTSSVVAQTGVAGASHYSAAKAGIVGLTKSLALELANKGITANSLALGYFQYGMLNTVPENLRSAIQAKIPLNRFGRAEEIAGAVKFLLSDDGAYTTGQVLHINGGLYG